MTEAKKTEQKKHKVVVLPGQVVRIAGKHEVEGAVVEVFEQDLERLTSSGVVGPVPTAKKSGKADEK